MSSKNHNIISKAKKGIKNYIDFYNNKKTHKGLIFMTIIILILLAYILFNTFVLQKHYLSFSTIITVITALGTLTLAFAAFQQIRQSEKFREDEKKEKQKDFDNNKKAIYSIVISKINYNVGMIPNLSFFSNIQTNPEISIFDLNILYNDKIILDMLKMNREYYSLLKTEAIYSTINAVDAINASFHTLNALIVLIDNMQNEKNTINKNNFLNPTYIDLCDKYYTAIIYSIKCIDILIKEGNLKLDIDFHKKFVDSQINALDNIANKIILDDKIIKNTIKNVKIDYNKKLEEIKSIRSNFSKYLQS